MDQSDVHSDSDGKKMSKPWCDSGDVLKLFYNCNFTLISKSKPLNDFECAYVLGSGMYSGTQATDWANEAVERLLYFSYRNRFAPLENGTTTDTNWGCMIRSGQMMLACAFMRYFNGGKPHFCDAVERLRKQVQVLFSDTHDAPFGIHAVTAAGAHHKIPCGKWYGPTSLATSLSQLGNDYKEKGGDGPVIIALSDRLVKVPQVSAFLKDAQHVLLIFPVMMGFGSIPDEYTALLMRCLEMQSSVGIVGGRNSAAYYFCGHQGDNVFYLDPHYVQRAFDSPNSTGALSSGRRTLQVSQMDTSMLLGFYIASDDDFSLFEKEMTEASARLEFPLVSFVADDNCSFDVSDMEMSFLEY